MIRNWKLRIIVFLVLLLILGWIFHPREINGDPLKLFIGWLFPISGAMLSLGATSADSYPDRLARSFTRVTSKENGVQIKSTWLCLLLVLSPTIPLFACGFLVGVFDQSFLPEHMSDLRKLFLGIASAAILLLAISLIPLGFDCRIKNKYVAWFSSYFGITIKSSEYKNSTIIEYAMENGGGGGPVVTIEFDDGEGGRKTRKLRFRNLYKCSREEFCDILAEYLGPPERITSVPTKKGHQPRLVENS